MDNVDIVVGRGFINGVLDEIVVKFKLLYFTDQTNFSFTMSMHCI